MHDPLNSCACSNTIVLQSQSIMHSAERCSAVALNMTGHTDLAECHTSEQKGLLDMLNGIICIRCSDLSVNNMLPVPLVIVVTAVLNVTIVAMACHWGIHFRVALRMQYINSALLCFAAAVVL